MGSQEDLVSERCQFLILASFLPHLFFILINDLNEYSDSILFCFAYFAPALPIPFKQFWLQL